MAKRVLTLNQCQPEMGHKAALIPRMSGVGGLAMFTFHETIPPRRTEALLSSVSTMLGFKSLGGWV